VIIDEFQIELRARRIENDGLLTDLLSVVDHRLLNELTEEEFKQLVGAAQV